MNKRELELLIGAVLDGEASPEEERRLQDHLASHPEDHAMHETLQRQHRRLTGFFQSVAAEALASSERAAGAVHGSPPLRAAPLRGWLRVKHVLPPLAVAAGLLIALLAGLREGVTPVAADEPIRVERTDFTVTVFNPIDEGGRYLYMPFSDDWTASYGVGQPFRPRLRHAISQGQLIGYPTHPGGMGMALVRDHRIVENLRPGRNTLRFTDVATTIDPTSVQLISETDPNNFRIVEQNFEFDLADAGTLLRRYIDHDITCVTREDVTLTGLLAAFDARSITLTDPATGHAQTINRARLRTVQLAELPENLVTRPTLVWIVEVDEPGPQRLTLSYLCGDVEWLARYTVIIHPTDDESRVPLDLAGWVSMTNRSGTPFPDAGLKLIAGDVNRVEDPWAIVPQQLGYANLAMDMPMAPPEALSGAGKEFTEKSFFEYYLYTLSAPSSIGARQTKQLRLLGATGNMAQRLYVYQPHTDPLRTMMTLIFKNEEDNQLGRPLPKGHIRFNMFDTDGHAVFVGSSDIDHTPRNEAIELAVSPSWHVIGERAQVRSRRISRNVTETAWRLTLRNHTDRAVRLRCDEPMPGGTDWTVLRATAEHTSPDTSTLRFEFDLPAHGEKTIDYTVRLRH